MDPSPGAPSSFLPPLDLDPPPSGTSTPDPGEGLRRSGSAPRRQPQSVACRRRGSLAPPGRTGVGRRRGSRAPPGEQAWVDGEVSRPSRRNRRGSTATELAKPSERRYTARTAQRQVLRTVTSNTGSYPALSPVFDCDTVTLDAAHLLVAFVGFDATSAAGRAPARTHDARRPPWVNNHRPPCEELRGKQGVHFSTEAVWVRWLPCA